MTGDERAGIVAQLELEPRRRYAARSRHRHAKRERLARQELETIRSFFADERRRLDGGFA
jgi:hypothetical protein